MQPILASNTFFEADRGEMVPRIVMVDLEATVIGKSLLALLPIEVQQANEQDQNAADSFLKTFSEADRGKMVPTVVKVD